MRRRQPRVSGKSSYSDWFFSGLLALTALSGFLPRSSATPVSGWPIPAYAVHLVFVYGLFVFFPFSKFAHAMYRPAALTFARQIRRSKPATTGVASARPSDRESPPPDRGRWSHGGEGGSMRGLAS